MKRFFKVPQEKSFKSTMWTGASSYLLSEINYVFPKMKV